MSREQGSQQSEQNVLSPQRRRLLKIGLYGGGAVMLGSFFGGAVKVVDASVSYQDGLDRIRPSLNDVGQAQKKLDNYKLKTEELGKSGKVDELARSFSNDEIKSAYQTRDQRLHPEKYHPEEAAKLEEQNNKDLLWLAPFWGTTFLSGVIAVISSINLNEERIRTRPHLKASEANA